jgi:hypothetical protein
MKLSNQPVNVRVKGRINLNFFVQMYKGAEFSVKHNSCMLQKNVKQLYFAGVDYA